MQFITWFLYISKFAFFWGEKFYESSIDTFQSYGGFVTSHALGDPGKIVNCGIAVAPVSDWRYYGKVNYLAFYLIRSLYCLQTLLMFLVAYP